MMEIYFFVPSINLFFFKVCKLKLDAKPSYRLKGNFLNSQSSFLVASSFTPILAMIMDSIIPRVFALELPAGNNLGECFEFVSE